MALKTLSNISCSMYTPGDALVVAPIHPSCQKIWRQFFVNSGQLTSKSCADVFYGLYYVYYCIHTTSVLFLFTLRAQK